MFSQLTIIASSLIAVLSLIYSRYGSTLTTINSSSTLVFTKDELSTFTGIDNTSIYLALVGHVYDVTKGRAYYGEKSGYAGFAGRDGSRAFVSGNFTKEGLIEKIDDLSDQQISEIWEWLSFYKGEKKYHFLGYLEGLYFDKQGNSLPYYDSLVLRLAKYKRDKMHEKDLKNGYPTCNSKWEQGKGSKVWCENGRVPRKWFVKPTESACHCFATPYSIPEEGTIEVYKNCNKEASVCEFPPGADR